MKVSLNWLRELVELPPTVPALVDLLTMAGVEVEGIESRGADFPFVVVCQLVSQEKHPNADRLNVCQVDEGTGTLRQIVTGASNQKVGDKIPLAQPGAVLPGNFKIKAGKLRDVDSNGMLCSAKELNLAEDAEGLMILPTDARVGAPISEVFKADTILDLEVTPNRPDLLSVYGIATEIAVLTGKKVTRPEWMKFELSRETLPKVEITTASPTYYSASLVRAAKVGSSPDWLRAKLESVGLRAINNAVDVTNYILQYAGHPCHVFDAAKVSGGIHVRDAHDGETIVALDGKTYALSAEDIVIADDQKVLAIAGVMGGEFSGVTEETSDIILEVANFEPRRIRRTARRLGLSTDSSYRFERGVDISNSLVIGQMAARMLAALTQAASATDFGSACTTPAVEEFMSQKSPAIPLRAERITKLLGIEVPDARVDEILTGFGLNKVEGGWQAPSRRPDLTREVDLIEEIARVVGMDAIPSKTQARFASASGTDKNYDRSMALRRAFVAQGLHEARSVTLVPSQPLGLAFTKTAPESCLRVKNPMLEEQVVLRPALVHGLLTAVRENYRAGAKSVRLFEVGRVFGTQRPEEFLHASIVISGILGERNWRTAEAVNADLYDLKALLTTALGAGITFDKDENPALALALTVKMNGKPFGFAGQLWPADARALDSAAPVLFAEIDLTVMWKASSPDAAKKYREIPRFPATTRDIAMLAPLNLAHAQIADTLAKGNEPLLAGVELFDVFTDPTGAKIPADQKSVAYSLTYRSVERTLTADEVNAAHSRLKDRLKSLGVTLRE